MKKIQISDKAYELVNTWAAKNNKTAQEWIDSAVGRIVNIDKVHEEAEEKCIPAADKSDAKLIHGIASTATKAVSPIQQQLISELQKKIAEGLIERGLPVTSKSHGVSFEYILAREAALMFLQADVYEYSLKSDFTIIKEYRGYP